MPYLYTGTGTRKYMDYVDASTDRMLEAEPGREYAIRATWDKLPVPPADGFWEEAAPAPEPAEADAKTAPKGKGKTAPAG